MYASKPFESIQLQKFMFHPGFAIILALWVLALASP